MQSRPSEDYPPSLSSSYTPSSSAQDSVETSNLQSMLTSDTPAAALPTRKSSIRSVRRSFSLIGKDLSSLIRSHSTSRRQSSFVQGDCIGEVVVAGYANRNTCGSESEMQSPPGRARTPRKQNKSENRLYSFLTRSRSRSQSEKSEAEASSVTSDSVRKAVPEHSISPSSSSFEQSDDSGVKFIRSSTPSSKIATSRPISSATTGTNTTITPPTPKVKSRVSSSIPVPLNTIKPTNLKDQNISKPKESARKKISTLFGIPLSRKSSNASKNSKSSRTDSRPNSPLLSPRFNAPGTPPPPVPPLLRAKPRQQGDAVDAAPKLWTSRVPTPRTSQPTTPTSSNHQLPQLPTPHLDIDPGPSASTISSTSHKADPQRMSLNAGVRVSNPRPKTSTASPPSSSIPLPSLESSSTSSRQNMSSVKSGIPTRPEVSRPRSMSLSREASTSGSSNSQPPISSIPRASYRKDSTDSSHRYRPMAILNEENASRDLSRKDKSVKGSSIIQSPVNGHTKAAAKAHVIRSTKHGSFDFERPSWHTSSIARSASGTSGASASTGTSGHPTQGPSKESLTGGSSASHGKQENLNIKTTLTSRPSDKLNRPSSRGKSQNGKQKTGHEPPERVANSVNHSRSHSTGEAASSIPNKSGLSSSLGRSSGSKFGSGIARLVGMTHGPFAFEKPVPSPSSVTSFVSRNNSNDHGSSRVNRKDTIEDTINDGDHSKRDRRQEVRRTTDFDIPVPVSESTRPSSMGYRSGGKGRSLDLGLGLAWAPRKIKEDALLPSPSLTFIKTVNTSSQVGRTPPPTRDKSERTKAGKEIAQLFRSALDDDAYASFKKYVHRFDAHEIPFDGPNGILAKTEHLLNHSSNLSENSKRRLLDNLIRIILQNA